MYLIRTRRLFASLSCGNARFNQAMSLSYISYFSEKHFSELIFKYKTGVVNKSNEVFLYDLKLLAF